jgi:hypothetical protein
MKKIVAICLVCCFILWGIQPVFSAEKRGTAAEAEAMVAKAVKYIKTYGREKAFAEFSNPKGKFIDRDLYITVYDMNGVCLAHGLNQKMIGKNMLDIRDPDGIAIVKERIEAAKTQDKFWKNFKWVDPLTKKIESKTQYTERMGDILINCGIYK